MLAISEMNTDQERASASRLEIHNHDRYVRPLVYRHAPQILPTVSVLGGATSARSHACTKWQLTQSMHSRPNLTFSLLSSLFNAESLMLIPQNPLRTSLSLLLMCRIARRT